MSQFRMLPCHTHLPAVVEIREEPQGVSTQFVLQQAVGIRLQVLRPWKSMTFMVTLPVDNAQGSRLATLRG